MAHFQFRWRSRPRQWARMDNTGALALAQPYGTQPLLMFFATPVFAKTKYKPGERSVVRNYRGKQSFTVTSKVYFSTSLPKTLCVYVYLYLLEWYRTTLWSAFPVSMHHWRRWGCVRPPALLLQYLSTCPLSLFHWMHARRGPSHNSRDHEYKQSSQNLNSSSHSSIKYTRLLIVWPFYSHFPAPVRFPRMEISVSRSVSSSTSTPQQLLDGYEIL